MKIMQAIPAFCILYVLFVMSCVTAGHSEYTDEGKQEKITEVSESEEGMKSHMKNQATVSIIGIPTMYGNEPRAYVVIVVDSGKQEKGYYVHPDYQDELRSLTGGRYRFSGYVYEGDERFFDARFHDYVFIPESWEPAVNK